jgi:protein-L-isoaspartate(D-aspartate) O-methyltransferase
MAGFLLDWHCRCFFSASLPAQLDELIWFDETRAVEPLAIEQRPSAELPETYPFGL